jgi:hypothetical protein
LIATTLSPLNWFHLLCTCIIMFIYSHSLGYAHMCSFKRLFISRQSALDLCIDVSGSSLFFPFTALTSLSLHIYVSSIMSQLSISLFSLCNVNVNMLVCAINLRHLLDISFCPASFISVVSMSSRVLTGMWKIYIYSKCDRYIYCIEYYCVGLPWVLCRGDNCEDGCEDN